MTAPNFRASFVGFLVLAAAANLGLACSGGGHATYPDGSFVGTGGHPANDAGAGSGGSGTGTGGSGTGGAAGGGAPDGGSPAQGATRVFPGVSSLLPSPGISCTFVMTAAGVAKPDQWCGMLRPGTVAGTVALWVFDLTKALTGTALTCAAGDANCFQVSASLRTTMEAIPGFFGQTLIYYEDASVFAWRPGWSAGRAILARDQVAQCEASPLLPTAICIKATTDTTVINLYAGRIDTQTGPALPLLEPISASVGSFGFSPDSASVEWSTAPTGGQETLKIQTIGDATTKKTVATNVTSWSVAPDGLRWLWLSQPATDANGLTTGTLQSATFPDGTGSKNIQAAVLDYASWSAKSVFVLANPGMVGADLTAIPDMDNPTTGAKALATQTAQGFEDLTAAGNILFFDSSIADPMVTGSFEVDLRALRADGTGACAVTATTNAANAASFTSSSMGVTWIRITDNATAGTRLYETVLTTLADCVSRSFSNSPAFFPIDVGPGMILQDNFNQTTITGRLSFTPFLASGALGVPTVIHASANSDIMPLFPDTPRVLYSVAMTQFEGGIYASAALADVPQPFMPDTQLAARANPSAGRPGLVQDRVRALARDSAIRLDRPSLLRPGTDRLASPNRFGTLLRPGSRPVAWPAVRPAVVTRPAAKLTN